MNVSGERVNNAVSFTSLPLFAQFILDNCLDAFVTRQIENGIAANIPFLRFLNNLPQGDIFDIAYASNSALLQALATNRITEYIDRSKSIWLDNRVPHLSRGQIGAEDITLISFVRRKTFRDLLPLYTTDEHVIITVMEEVDRFTVLLDSELLNVLIKIQREQISNANVELERHKQRLLEAQAIGNIASFEWDIPRDLWEYSQQMNAILEVPDTIHVTLPEFRNKIHSDDLTSVTDSLREGMRTGVYQCEYRLNINDSDKYVLSRGRFVYNDGKPVRMIGTLIDITEKETIIRKLEESEAQNKEAEALTHIGNWSFVPATGALHWSDELFRIFGLRPQSVDITREFFFSLLPEEEKDRIASAWSKVDNFTTVPEQTFHIVISDGTKRILRSKGNVIRDHSGKVMKLIGTIQDITSEHHLTEKLREREQYLNHLNVSLEIKNAELVAKNKELESFNFISSHDLQEPLRKIQIFTDKLITENGDNLSGNTLNLIARIRVAAQRMQKLIEDFLEFSQTLYPVRPVEQVDLNAVLEDAKADLSAKIAEKNAIITNDNLPHIKAIRYQMKQLFVNLISNSLKYAQPGERPVVEIRAYQESESRPQPVVKITFSDNGIGFEQKYATRVFELFQRLHQKTEFSGTGIGLALCKKICENHSGTITATSQLMGGSTFTIVLPQ